MVVSNKKTQKNKNKAADALHDLNDSIKKAKELGIWEKRLRRKHKILSPQEYLEREKEDFELWVTIYTLFWILNKFLDKLFWDDVKTTKNKVKTTKKK